MRPPLLISTIPTEPEQKDDVAFDLGRKDRNDDKSEGTATGSGHSDDPQSQQQAHIFFGTVNEAQQHLDRLNLNRATNKKPAT